MTRTWFTRSLLMTPLVALASLGQAQTPAPPASTDPRPTADAGKAATSDGKLTPAPTTIAKPVPKPAVVGKPAVPVGPANATPPAPHAAGGARPVQPPPGTMPAARPMAPAAKPRPAVPPAARTAMPTVSTGAGGTGAATGAAPAVKLMAPHPALKAAPELDQLKFLRGRWRCDGKQFATPLFGPEHTFTAIGEGKPLVDGFWDQFTYEERRTKDHHGMKVQGQWGWDQGSKHLVRAAGTNAGDWDFGTSPGLEGDKIVWTGELSGPMGRMSYRHVFIKKSDREWTHALELKDPTGKFTPINDVSCKR